MFDAAFPEHKCVLFCQMRQHHCKHESGERIDSSGLVFMEVAQAVEPSSGGAR